MRAETRFRPAANLPGGGYDVLVIGAGLGGLISALLLAREGFKVCVLEQHSRPGGCLHRFSRRGVTFNGGFHFLGGAEGDGTMAHYLRHLGVADRLRFRALDPDGFDILQFPDFTFRVPAGWDALVRRLGETFPGERGAIGRYAAACRRICRENPAYSLRPPVALPSDLATKALGPFLRTLTADPRLIAVLCGQNMLYGMPPEETPLGVHAFVVDSMLQGPACIEGGGDALAGVLVEAIRARGGTVRTGARVTALSMDGRRVAAAAIEGGETVPARCFVSDAHPKVTLSLLPPGALRPAYVHRVENLREGIGCLGGYFTTARRDAEAARHNVYVYPSLDLDEAYRTAGFGHGQGAGKCLFISFPEETGAAVEPPGVVQALGMMSYREVLPFAATRTGNRGPEYEALKARYGEQMRRAVEAALPSLQGRLTPVAYSTPLTNRDFTGTPEGAIYGVRHSVDQWGAVSLSPRTRIENLLLTGQSVVMLGAVGVTVGAFITCATLLEDATIFERVARA